MAIKSVLFNFDGTLVDSDDAVVRSFQNAFTKSGLQAPTAEKVMQFSTLKMVDWVKALLKEQGVEDEAKAQALRELVAIKYITFYFPSLGKLPDGSNEALKKLKRKYRLAIVTNNSREQLQKIMGLVKLADAFRLSVCYDEAQTPKPDPACLVYAMDKLGVTKDETIYLGDSQTDVDTAKNAGVRFILLSKPRNAELQGVQRVANLDELYALLEIERKTAAKAKN